MHQRKQDQSYRPVRQEQLRQHQQQAATQEDGRFAGAASDGEALSRALDMQARQIKDIQRRQGQ
jgi:hypothetical protein